METYTGLAEKLIEKRLISDQEMDRVVKLRNEQQGSLARLVVELGFLSEDDLLPVLRDYFGVPLISLKDQPQTAVAVEFSSGIADFLRLARMVPLRIDGRELVVAKTDPSDIARPAALAV